MIRVVNGSAWVEGMIAELERRGDDFLKKGGAYMENLWLNDFLGSWDTKYPVTIIRQKMRVTVEVGTIMGKGIGDILQGKGNRVLAVPFWLNNGVVGSFVVPVNYQRKTTPGKIKSGSGGGDLVFVGKPVNRIDEGNFVDAVIDDLASNLPDY